MRSAIKQFIRQVLATRGYEIITQARLRELEQLNESVNGSLIALQSASAELIREVAETKGGVSALQGESGETLSHIVVMRRELGRELEQTKGGVSGLQGQSGEILSHLIALRREINGLGAGISTNAAPGLPRPNGWADRIIALPRQLDRIAMEYLQPNGAPELCEERRALAQHYALLANLVSQEWVQKRQLPGDPYPDDDLTVEYARPVLATNLGPEIEVDTAEPWVPWRHLWADPDCAIFLVLGQSNAANHGEVRYAAEREVYSLDFLRMRCTRAADPLAGASGTGGSIWPRLGDRLIEKGLCRRVLFVPLAFEGSFITHWIPGGPMHNRTALALSRLRKELGSPALAFSAVLWQQGEAEASSTKMSARAYKMHFHDIVGDLRAGGVFAPVFPAVATTCEAGGRPQLNIAAIREAQLGLAEPAGGIFAGPDTDSLGAEFRFDSCHFSGPGLDRCAALWCDVLSARWSLLARAQWG